MVVVVVNTMLCNVRTNRRHHDASDLALRHLNLLLVSCHVSRGTRTHVSDTATYQDFPMTGADVNFLYVGRRRVRISR